MAIPVKRTLDLGGSARITGLQAPIAGDEPATKTYADSLASGLVVTSVEIDFGTTSVTSKTFTITDAGVTGTSKILCFQAGRAATGQSADENEWTKLALTANPGTGSFTLWAECINGTVTGKFIIDYLKG